MEGPEVCGQPSHATPERVAGVTERPAPVVTLPRTGGAPLPWPLGLGLAALLLVGGVVAERGAKRK